jgi:serine/arginine repetitive matrix protein 1
VQNPDPKKMQILLTGFLNGKNARLFMAEMWDLLLSAQESPSGIPQQFLEQKKEEIKKRMVCCSQCFCHIL